jgi:hypothetical protein
VSGTWTSTWDIHLGHPGPDPKPQTGSTLGRRDAQAAALGQGSAIRDQLSELPIPPGPGHLWKPGGGSCQAPLLIPDP